MSKKYLSLDGLIEYDSLIKEKIDTKANSNHAHSWNDLEDKPFGKSMPEPIINTTVTISGTSGSFEDDDGMRSLTNSKDYLVVWDDLECVMESMTHSSYDIYILNYSSGDAPVSEINYGSDSTSVTTSSDQTGTHTLKIYDAEAVEFKQINEEFIPDTIARVADITETHTWENLPDRPFFVDGTLELVESSHTFTIETDGGNEFQNTISYEPELVDGQLYRVIVNDANYDIYAYAYSNENLNNVIVGNPRVLNTEYESNNDLPFCLFIADSSVILYHETAGTYTVEIYKITVDYIKQIDEVYIPDTIARVNDITVISTDEIDALFA